MVVLICASMYITGAPIGNNIITSLDGRYLIPIAPLIFLLFYNNKIKFEIEKRFNLVIICFIIFTLTLITYLFINTVYMI